MPQVGRRLPRTGEVAEARREHAAGTLGETPRERVPERRWARARCGEVELFYEGLGDLDDPPVMLIMGVGAQLPMWPATRTSPT